MIQNSLARSGTEFRLQKCDLGLADFVHVNEIEGAVFEESRNRIISFFIGVQDDVPQVHPGLRVHSIKTVVFGHPFDEPKWNHSLHFGGPVFVF